MTIKIFQLITHFRLQGIEFYPTPNFTFTSSQELKKDNFSDSVFEKAVGFMRYKKIHSANDYIFSIKDNLNSIDEKELTSTLANSMDEVHQYASGICTFLWFIKDNSINVSDVFGEIKEGENHSLLAISPISIITNCYGEMVESIFTRNEIDMAYAISRKYTSICPQNHGELENRIERENLFYDNNIVKGEDDNIIYNTFNRIERAIKFLQVVREIGYLPRKISMYMPIFECLFSTESSEVTHKVAERVAFYIGLEADGKKEIFKRIKEAYNIRSRYLHGEELANKQKEKQYQIQLAIDIDDITRHVLRRIIMEDSENFLLKKEEFEKWVSDIIFQ